MSPINHGTESGYFAHRSRKTKPCQPCKTAHSEANKKRRTGEADERLGLPPGEWVPNGRGTVVRVTWPDFTPAEMLSAHSAFNAGNRTAYVVAGERAYQRLAKQQQRARAVAS